jgi:NuA3 HAT complex component NTO1
LDSKGIFTAGFDAIQVKLDEKFYTSVSTFSEDVSSVFSSVIKFAKLTNIGDAEQELSGVAHSSLTSEQKQIKALAKRIIKAIQPYFADALRKESDLAGKRYESELPDLEALLDQRLRRQTDATSELQPVRVSTEPERGHKAESIPHYEGTIAHGDAGEPYTKENGTMHLAPTPEENAADHHLNVRDELADEAAIAAQFSQDAMHSAPPDVMDIDQPETHGRSSGAPTAPLTPPRSEKDLLAPLANGGIPWYMEAFDPVGTTVHDEKWTGRDVLRDMSEELSDMDEDALNGLADADDMQLSNEVAPEMDITQQKVVRKLKKRSRYR